MQQLAGKIEASTRQPQRAPEHDPDVEPKLAVSGGTIEDSTSAAPPIATSDATTAGTTAAPQPPQPPQPPQLARHTVAAASASTAALPAIELSRHGQLFPPASHREWEPLSVGVGSDGFALVAWSSSHVRDRVLITRHYGRTSVVPVVEVPTTLRVGFVQPLPDNRILLVQARTRDGHNAEVWTKDGDRVAAERIGDAVEHVLTTRSGAIWVGYFDEAMGAGGPEGHGLARFSPSLSTDWLYPRTASLPQIFGSYALNVTDEATYCCPYINFHVIGVRASVVSDYGPAPVRFATRLLVDAHRGVLIGGDAAQPDLISGFRMVDGIVEPTGPLGRLVMPDGADIPRSRSSAERTICRGTDLHILHRANWYRVGLGDLFPA